MSFAHGVQLKKNSNIDNLINRMDLFHKKVEMVG